MKLKLLRQIVKMSKLCLMGVFLQALLCSMIIAKDGNAQRVSIEEMVLSIEINNSSLNDAFAEISRQTNLDFAFDRRFINEKQRVSLSAENESLGNILRSMSKDLQIRFKRINGTIHVSPSAAKPKNQEVAVEEELFQNTVSGMVTSADDGEPLPGVNILIKGTTTGTTTDIDGKYSLSVTSDAILLFSFVGYVTQEIPVQGQTALDIVLASDLAQLQEVVVVGYGSMERQNVTGSIVTVDVDEIQKTPIANPVEALRGRVSGLQVTRGSGQPGAGVNFKIRGTNSLGGARGNGNDVSAAINDANQPIIVLDGVPVVGGNLSEINPDDIKSINILKDAAASAIYGSQGANGAVLITTKSGDKGVTKFNVDAYTGYVELANRLDIMNGDQYVKYLLDSRIANGETNPTVNGVLDPIELNNYVNGKGVDWQDLLLGTGRQNDISIGASGGGEKYSFYINADAYLEDGIVVESDYKRYSFRLNSDFKPTNWLQVGARVQLTRSESDETSNVISDFNINGGFAPYIPISTNSPLGSVYDEDGNYTKFINTDRFQINSLHRYSESVVDRIVNRTYVNPFVNVDFGGGFKYTLNTFAENRNDFYGRFQSSNYGDEDPSEAQIQQTSTKNYLFDNILTFNRDFGKHSVNATFVYGMQKFEYERQDNIAESIPTDLLGYHAIGDALDTKSRVGWDTDESGRVYAVGRVGYGYDDRYNVTFSLRRDGSSKFGPNNRYGYFPSASFAWNANNEAFLETVDFLSILKVRTSYGVLGNDNIGTYLYRAGSSNVQILLGVDPESGEEVFFNGYGVGYNASNPDLRWEESRQSNIGIDFGFFNNRLGGSFDLWQTKTKDLLLYETIIPVNGGFSSYPSNVGETQNWGIDVGLNGQVLERSGFTWDMNINWAMDRNKIVRLSRASEDENGNPVDNPANGWFIGENIREIYNYEYLGVWQTAEESEAAEFGAVPGDPKIADIDNNGVINDDDRTFLGNPTPDWYGGVTNIFRYKGIELSVLIEAVQGVKQVNSYIGGYTGRGNQLNINYWTPTNPSNEFPRVGNGNAMAGGLFSNAIKVQDASFVSLRNISLSYNLPDKILEKTPLTNVNVYLRGNNLKYWTDYTLAFSPESGSGSYPITKTWVLGARFTF